MVDPSLVAPPFVSLLGALLVVSLVFLPSLEVRLVAPSLVTVPLVARRPVTRLRRPLVVPSLVVPFVVPSLVIPSLVGPLVAPFVVTLVIPCLVPLVFPSLVVPLFVDLSLVAPLVVP